MRRFSRFEAPNLESTISACSSTPTAAPSLTGRTFQTLCAPIPSPQSPNRDDEDCDFCIRGSQLRLSVAGMRESIKPGMAEPVNACSTELNW
jgi:hypothetical protein